MFRHIFSPLKTFATWAKVRPALAKNTKLFRKPHTWAAAGLVFVVITTGATLRTHSDEYFAISKNIDVLGKILQEISLNYVDDVEPEKFMRIGVDAMLESLDPYTSFIGPEELEDFNYLSTGQYGGIGAGLDKFEDRVIVSEVYENRPAFQAGLKAGDEILRIDGVRIDGKKHDNLDVRNMLRGRPNTVVEVEVKRLGSPSPVVVKITRHDIKIDNVPYYGNIHPSLDPHIGYIHLAQFTKDASVEVRKALEHLKTQDPQLKGVILDLRGNPGGLLYEAINVSNVFVHKGEKIVETRGKMEGAYKRYDAEMDALDPNIPVAVLVNKSSASASEIVAGVIQDLDRGIIVGRKSFGKGLVQTSRPLSYKTQLKVTTARYYTPSGRCIQAIDYAHKHDKNGGRTPDSLKNVFKTRNNRSVLDGGGVDPDVKVEDNELHKITGELLSKRLIFDFATQYYYGHPTLPKPKDFKITDELYQQFTAFVQSKGFEYTSRFAKDLEEVEKDLKDEAYYKQLEGQYGRLKKTLEDGKKNDIQMHRAEITEWLRSEIVSRYYFRAGRIETAIVGDKDVQEAAKALADPKRYQQILRQDVFVKNK